MTLDRWLEREEPNRVLKKRKAELAKQHAKVPGTWHAHAAHEIVAWCLHALERDEEALEVLLSLQEARGVDSGGNLVDGFGCAALAATARIRQIRGEDPKSALSELERRAGPVRELGKPQIRARPRNAAGAPRTRGPARLSTSSPWAGAVPLQRCAYSPFTEYTRPDTIMRPALSIVLLALVSCSSPGGGPADLASARDSRTETGLVDRGPGDRGAEDRSPDRGPGADGPMGADLAISKDFCTGWCGFRSRCQGYSLSLCMAQCQKPSAVLKQKFQPIVAETLATCFSTLACSKSDDTCWNQALLASDPGCFSNATVIACVSKRKACSQGDDICYYYCGLQASGQAAFSACLGASCSELEACLTPLTSIK